MSLSTRCLRLFFLVAMTLGSAPPIANLAIYQPLSIVSSTNALPSTPSALNSAVESEDPLYLDDTVQSLNDTSRTPFCDGGKFGYDLNRNSCLDAWASIPTDSQTVTYGVRSSGQFQAPLPVRYLSPDGKCFIDINRAREAVWDVATNLEVSNAARRLLDRCVIRESRERGKRATGGRLSGVGRNEGLTLVVGVYDTDDVACIADPPFDDEGECSKLLKTVPVAHASFSWALLPEGGEQIGNKSIRGCTAMVRIVGGITEKCSWRDIWAAAVAINEKCVNKGKAGVAFGLGVGDKLMVQLGP